jgi:hypothetical protein
MAKEPKRTNEKKAKPLHKAVKYTGMGFQMLGIIALGTFGGIQLDKNTEGEFPLWTLILSLASVFIALYTTLREIIKDSNDS